MLLIPIGHLMSPLDQGGVTKFDGKLLKRFGIKVECTECGEFLFGTKIINSGHQPARGLITANMSAH